MSESYKKLIKTLQSLFEMDKADLDFGIYRIMNQKRDEMNRFLESDLLPQVKQAFADYAQGGQQDLKKELELAKEQAKNFGVADVENAPPVLAIKEKIQNSLDIHAVENEVYSHLNTFFSRYYDKGDFISLRRYKKDTYAIPYEGEEVKLYWANHDQYYIKSSEHLRDYAFIVKSDDEKTVRVKLVEADIEKDNNITLSGEERCFMLDESQPLEVIGNELHIHFKYITKPKYAKQSKLNEEAVKTIFAQTGFDDWLAALKTPAPTESDSSRTMLEKHLNDYTARNTTDYFIHKDLGDFLRRELDFYIKNEVLFLDDIDDTAINVTEQHLRKIKVIRSIGHKIIRMLAQIEDFQKKLWLKKKFVVATEYCLTLDKVPAVLHADVVKNEAQWQEWVKLGFIDNAKPDSDLLTQLPYLVLDTQFFDEAFKDKLIASFDNLDAQLNGLLIHSENFQALNLLHERYRNNIDCIYIDPPYNTPHSRILYKNSFLHSTWITLIAQTFPIVSSLKNESASFGIAVDDFEQAYVATLLDSKFPNLERSTIIVNHHPQGAGGRLSRTHEYYMVLSSSTDPSLQGEPKEDLEEDRIFMRSGTAENNYRHGRWKSFYALLYNPETGRIVDAEKPYPLEESYPLYPTDNGLERIYPINSRGEERVWRASYETGKLKAINGELIRTDRGTIYQQLDHSGKRNTLFSNWTDSMFNAGTHGSNLLNNLGLGGKFDYPKSLYTVATGLWAQSFGKSDLTVLDYFSGSGTTAHAVIHMNRTHHGNRKYVLVEMGEYFNTVLKPRIQKIVFSKDWKDNKPKPDDNGDYQGISHAFKYLKLESYEDVLNNLVLKRSKGQQDLIDQHAKLREDYLLGYWLDVETQDSAGLLNLDRFEDPFNYQLNIAVGTANAARPTKIDLVETFNYLLGLTVKHIDTVRSFKVVQGVNPKDESVLVIWRNLKEKDNAALEAFLDKSHYTPRDTEYDHIYVNGDHTLDDPRSKVKMIEMEFKRLMFAGEKA
jgi:adenine-specific DNA-methyltransferase